MKNFSAFFSLAALALLASCHGSDKPVSSPESKAPPVPVKVVTLAETSAATVYPATGTVRAKISATISSKIAAYVQSVRVQEGDRVRAGQLLVSLDAQDLDAQYRVAVASREEVAHSLDEADSGIAEAKNRLDLAQTTYGRLKDLYDKRSISNQEFDEGTARLKAAQAAYDQALAHRKQAESRGGRMDAEVRSADITRGYASLVAPFAGIVVARNVEPGVLASPGMPLLTIEQEGGYRFEAAVEESRLPEIHLRDRVPVQIDAFHQEFSAEVAEIVPVADPASHSYTVKLSLPSTSGLHTGLFGRALFPSGHAKSLAVPADAVETQGDLDSVLVAEDGFVRRRLISTGSKSEKQISVLSGLKSGDRLIYPVPPNLQEGSPIEVQQ